jgi:DNA-binding CsgD family transcriptional regulator
MHEPAANRRDNERRLLDRSALYDMSSIPFDGAALHLAALLLDAVADPRRCIDVLRALCKAFEADSGQLALIERPSNTILARFSYGLSDAAKRTYAGFKDILKSDPRLRAAIRHPGQPALCRNIVPEATLLRSELYKTFLKPAGIGDSLLLPLVVENDRFVLALALMRGTETAPFDDAHLVQLGAIAPHLTRVSEAAARRLTSDDELAVLRTLCERSVIAILVVDASGRIVFENPAASELLQRQSGLRRSDGRLSHVNQQHAQALAEAIAARKTGGQRTGSRHLLLPHGTGTLLHATFSLLPRAGSHAHGLPDKERHIAISLVDTRRTYEPDPAVLQVSFGLTAAEASILKLLAEGTPIGRIATLRGSAIGTVRNQINTIMSKTNTHRQTDLIRLALTAAPLFRDE